MNQLRKLINEIRTASTALNLLATTTFFKLCKTMKFIIGNYVKNKLWVNKNFEIEKTKRLKFVSQGIWRITT